MIYQGVAHRSITPHRSSSLGIPSFISRFSSALGDVSSSLGFHLFHSFHASFQIIPSLPSDPFQIVYTNSLLATLNARKMIRIAGEGIQTTSENLSVSLREFPKNGPMMVNYLFLYIYFYLCLLGFG